VPPAALAGSLIGEAILPHIESGRLTCLLSDSMPAAGAALAPGGSGGLDATHRGADASGGFFRPHHAHGAHEFCWPIDGRCRVGVEDQHVVLHPGLAYVARPGERHQLWPMPGPESFRTLWWYVTERGVNLTIAGAADHTYLTRIGFVAIDPSPAPLASRVVRELEAQRPHFQRIVRALLLDLAAGVLRALDEAHQEAQQEFPGRRWSSRHVDRAAQYVEAHHGPEITLTRVAAAIGLSPHYLTALFRRYTGRTLMSYVSDVRHREALALLRATDLDVAEVARNVGYRDAYYFSRVFKAREGCAPAHFRNLVRTHSP
jgi:AraC-like DNA-binding protein